MMRSYQVTQSWEQAPYPCEAMDVDPLDISNHKYFTHKSSFAYCGSLRIMDYMAAPIFVKSLASPHGNITRPIKTTNDNKALKRKRRHANNNKTLIVYMLVIDPEVRAWYKYVPPNKVERADAVQSQCITLGAVHFRAWQVTVTGSRLLPVAGPLFLQFLVRWPTFWGGSISPEGFLSSVLLWLVIIVAVVGVGVTVVVVIIVAGRLCLSDPLASEAMLMAYSEFEVYEALHSLTTGASLGLGVLLVFAMLAAYASRAVETLSATSFLMAA
ncbi:hypothetical protein Tco_0468375 [Tanacetum coccineum]